jgi:drug/metabolite transporter (DMT)-like permease
MSEPHRPNRPRFAIAVVLLAMLLLASMDAISKHLTASLAVPQILAIRFWVFLIFSLSLAGHKGFKKTLKSAKPKTQLLRGIIMIGQMTAFIVAVRVMPLADVHTILAAAPILVMALAAVFLKEKIGPRRITAVAISFIGVLIIIRPGSTVFEPASLIALGGACCWATFQILLRVVGAKDSAETTTLYSAMVGFVCFSAAAPLVWQPPTPEVWAWLVLLGLLGACGHLLLSSAYRNAEASTLQPFSYAMPLFAVILGWIAFGDFPDMWTIAGGGIVIASGLYALKRERSSNSKQALINLKK